MNLFVETLTISACMTVLGALPLFSKRIQKYSKLFFLLGTGALSGILFFDLLPDIFKMGGTPSLWGVGIIWGIYSLLHLSHLRHHQDDHKKDEVHHHDHTNHHKSSRFFLLAMIGHCLASGILLVASLGLQGLNRTVFLALLFHKAYEALTVSSILLEKAKSKARAILSVTAYSISFPIGVLLTYSFRSVLIPSLALILTSLAAGSLMGCLIYDFIVPSFAQIKSRRYDLLWIAVGLFLTQLVMKSF